jgi:hypothetical protein
MATRLIASAKKEDATVINVVDLNVSEDVEYYLTSQALYRTLDDFCTAENAEMFEAPEAEARVIFMRKCASKSIDNLYFMGPNTRHSLTSEMAQSFVKHSRKVFKHTIIDCREANDKDSGYFYDVADYVLVVINQDMRSLDTIKRELIPLYEKHARKIIFVVNKYIDTLGPTTLRFKEAEVKSQLMQAQLPGKIFKLPFSPELINHSNDKTLHKFSERKSELYLTRLDELNQYLLGVTRR